MEKLAKEGIAAMAENRELKDKFAALQREYEATKNLAINMVETVEKARWEKLKFEEWKKDKEAIRDAVRGIESDLEEVQEKVDGLFYSP